MQPDEQPNPTLVTKSEAAKLLLVSLLLIFLRSPMLLLQGRVCGEEGTVYLQKAWSASLPATLFAVEQGYYSLTMNVLAVLTGRVFPLEWAGLVLTTGALAALLLTAFLAITCEAFTTRRARLFAAGVCILTPAIEVWLTAEDIQFVLALATAIVCLSSEVRYRWLRTVTVAVAGLTGPVSCVLAPFFLYRAYRRRSLMAYLQAGLLTACALGMGTLTLRSVLSGARHIDRTGKVLWFGPILFLKIFSVEFFTRVGAILAQKLCVQHQNVGVCALFWLLTEASLLLFWRAARAGGSAGKTCFLMALTVLCFNYSGIGEPLAAVLVGAYRYFFTGFALFSLVLVLGYDRASGNTDRKLSRRLLVLVCLALFSGALDAVGYWGRFQVNNPTWQSEVAQWRQNPAYEMRVSTPFWTQRVHLDPK